MRNQLRYAGEDIFAHKWRYLIFFTQISVTLILIASSISLFLAERDYLNKLSIIMGMHREEIYKLSDLSTSDQWNVIINNEDVEDSLRRLSGLYNFIRGNFQTYTAGTGSLMHLNDSKPYRFFAVDPDFDPGQFYLLKIDDRFQDYFGLRTIKGRLFSEEDFSSTQKEIPLLLGYDFQNYHNLDDVIIDTAGKSYRVIGFLDRSNFYLNPVEGRTVFHLDRMFITPFQQLTFDTICYHEAIFSTFVITDDPAVLRQIQEKSNQLGLFTFDFRGFTDQLEYLSEYTKSNLIFWGTAVAAILFFALAGFIAGLMQYIDRHTKEFAIHLLCGARIRSIIQRILIQILAVILLANIVVAAVHKLSLTMLIALVSSLLIGLIVISGPVFVLSKTEINTILKRSR
jgi:hypothetical protein